MSLVGYKCQVQPSFLRRVRSRRSTYWTCEISVTTVCNNRFNNSVRVSCVGNIMNVSYKSRARRERGCREHRFLQREVADVSVCERWPCVPHILIRHHAIPVKQGCNAASKWSRVDTEPEKKKRKKKKNAARNLLILPLFFLRFLVQYSCHYTGAKEFGTAAGIPENRSSTLYWFEQS